MESLPRRSATRNRALPLRGLRSNSSWSARMGLRVSDLQTRIVTKRVLDQAIFQRMEADNGQAAAWQKAVG